MWKVSGMRERAVGDWVLWYDCLLLITWGRNSESEQLYSGGT
jgi:hypothetical protein